MHWRNNYRMIAGFDSRDCGVYPNLGEVTRALIASKVPEAQIGVRRMPLG
jgi:hypothetical protein